MPIPERQYPVNLILEGEPCLVVGGGPIAARKAEGLLDCGARVHVVAVRVGDEVKTLSGVTWDERPYLASDVDGQRLVITATDDPAVNRQVSADARAAGIWVNSADDPENCTFTLPAIVRQGPIMVTISTAGRSPALAVWLKGRLSAELGPEYTELLDVLAAARDSIRASGRSTEGLAWQKALESGMLELIRAGRVDEARERLEACLSSS